MSVFFFSSNLFLALRLLRLEREGESFAQNLARRSGQYGLDTVADPDTLAYYAERADVPAMEKLLAGTAGALIRMRALDASRLYSYFTIATNA